VLKCLDSVDRAQSEDRVVGEKPKQPKVGCIAVLAEGAHCELQDLVPVRIPEVVEVSPLNRRAQQSLTTDLSEGHREAAEDGSFDCCAIWYTDKITDPGLFTAPDGIERCAQGSAVESYDEVDLPASQAEVDENDRRLLAGKQVDEMLKHRIEWYMTATAERPFFADGWTNSTGRSPA
jgi:hypothetical protein